MIVFVHDGTSLYNKFYILRFFIFPVKFISIDSKEYNLIKNYIAKLPTIFYSKNFNINNFLSNDIIYFNGNSEEQYKEWIYNIYSTTISSSSLLS